MDALDNLLLRYGGAREDDGSLVSLRLCVLDELRTIGRDLLFRSLRANLGTSNRVTNLIVEAAVEAAKP